VFLNARTQLFHLMLRDFEPPRPVGAIRWGGSGSAGHGGYYSTLSSSCGDHRICSAPQGRKLLRLGRIALRVARLRSRSGLGNPASLMMYAHWGKRAGDRARWQWRRTPNSNRDASHKSRLKLARNTAGIENLPQAHILREVFFYRLTVSVTVSETLPALSRNLA